MYQLIHLFRVVLIRVMSGILNHMKFTIAINNISRAIPANMYMYDMSLLLALPSTEEAYK